jgi:hypothetical protein
VDENGVITGVSVGVAEITATDAMGNSDTITITVTAQPRSFYGYDELSQSWVRFGTDGKILDTWADAEGLSPIVAAQYIDGVLYAYDEDGFFYTIDTETFARTFMGNGINGLTASLEAWDHSHNEQIYYVDGILHYAVDNIPSGFAATASRTLSAATLPYALAMADKGVEQALLADAHLRRGLTTYKGMLTLLETAQKHSMPFTDPKDAILKA